MTTRILRHFDQTKIHLSKERFLEITQIVCNGEETTVFIPFEYLETFLSQLNIVVRDAK
jgi:hypothetical protein